MNGANEKTAIAWKVTADEEDLFRPKFRLGRVVQGSHSLFGVALFVLNRKHVRPSARTPVVALAALPVALMEGRGRAVNGLQQSSAGNRAEKDSRSVGRRRARSLHPCTSVA